ncbi:MAG: hypothetical protein ACREA9_14445 [Pyrinomonadaceae bacterium]
MTVATTNAQTTPTRSATDGSTPLGLTPGSPAGSFALSGFENVNLYNGNLNFHLPLLSVGGRGGAGYTITLAIDNKSWRVKTRENEDPNVTPGVTHIPTNNRWANIGPGYGPGVLLGRQSGDGSASCAGRTQRWPLTLTRLTFIAADGTEYELRDQQTQGQPLYTSNPCADSPPTRGTVFVTADGSAATFISDSVIADRLSPNGPGVILPSGYLMLAEGTRYRIDNGLVSWMRDRNGNQLSFASSTNANGQSLYTITDALRRQVTVTYADLVTVFYDEITYRGFAGAARTIRVHKTALSNVLRQNQGTEPASHFQIQTVRSLFPEFIGGNATDPFNPTVCSAVELPDGRRYELRYNSFAELARVVLPTAGAIEYDHTVGSGAYAASDEGHVYRRVTERRVYSDGTTLESKTTYSDPVVTTDYAAGLLTSAVTVEQRTPGGALLGRSKHYFFGSAADSFDPANGGTSYPTFREGREYKAESFAADGATLLRRSETRWANRAYVSWWVPCGACGSPGDTEPANDPRVTETATTLTDVTPNLVSKQTFAYDDSVPYNNRNNVKEYDFGNGAPGALLRETRTTYVTAGNYVDAIGGAHQRSLPSQVSVYDAAGIERSRTSYEYDSYLPNTNHAALLNQSGISGLDPAFTTSYTTRGNATATTHYLLVNGSVTGSVSAYAQFDIAGNVTKAIDPRGCVTTLDYTDRFGAPDGEARSNAAPSELSSAGQSSYAFATLVTNCLGQTAYTQFDYYLGRAVNAEDANGIVTSASYGDLLDRPTQVIGAANQSSGVKGQSTFTYDDPNRTITTTSDLNAFNDLNPLKSQTIYDGLGRTIESRQYEGDTNYIAVKTQYDALGRAFKTSNPYRPWQSEVAIWTTSAFDALGRVISVTTPDSAAVTSSYSGNTVTVMDQTGRARKSVADGLGRLTTVYEDPGSLNYSTSYSYDTLDNLISVNQGTQTRGFVYDSLKRLTSATNPESGTISYLYDANGNLTQKTDARGVVSTYAYDALNRNTSVSYTNDPANTPAINRYYDGWRNGNFTNIANVKGRLWQTETSGTNGARTTVNSYDALGRPLSESQQFYASGAFGPAFTVQRTYDLAGHVASQIYPSGHAVNYNYDGAGRLGDKDAQNLAFTGNLGDGVTRTYSRGISYTALGGLSQEQFGTDTAIYNKLFYNSRGQLAEIREGLTPNDTNWERGAIINFYSTCWGMCGGPNSNTQMTDNNGNLKRQEIHIPGGPMFAQTFAYDSLNRLQSASEDSSWRQEYVYDRYGNRRIDPDPAKTFGAGINNKNFTVNAANNRLGVPGGQSGTMHYDNAGNLDIDTYSGSALARAYDAENRMTSETQANSNEAGRYTYNADGSRIKRNVNGVETWQVYGMDGELLS